MSNFQELIISLNDSISVKVKENENDVHVYSAQNPNAGEFCIGMLNIEIAVVEQSIQTLNKIQDNLSKASGNLIILEKNTPRKCSDEYENRLELNLAYEEFLEQITISQNEIQFRQQLFFDLKHCFQNIFDFFSNVNSSLQDLIERDKEIPSNFLEKYNIQRVQIEYRYQKIHSEKDTLSNQFHDTIQLRKNVQNFTNDVAHFLSDSASKELINEKGKNLKEKKYLEINQKKEIDKMKKQLETKLENQQIFVQSRIQNEQSKIIDCNMLNNEKDDEQMNQSAKVELNTTEIRQDSSGKEEFLETDLEQKEVLKNSYQQVLEKIGTLNAKSSIDGSIGQIYLRGENIPVDEGKIEPICSAYSNFLTHSIDNTLHNTLFIMEEEDTKQSSDESKSRQNKMPFSHLEENINQLKKENVIFVTLLFINARRTNYQEYANTLANIKKKNQKILIFFVIGFGYCIDSDSLKEINRLLNEDLMIANVEKTERFKTYFEIRMSSEIQEVFQQISNIKIESISAYYVKQLNILKAQLDSQEVKKQSNIQWNQNSIQNSEIIESTTQDNSSIQINSSYAQISDDTCDSDEVNYTLKSFIKDREEIAQLEYQILKSQIDYIEIQQECQNSSEIVNSVEDSLSHNNCNIHKLITSLGFTEIEQFNCFNAHIYAIEHQVQWFQEFYNNLVLMANKLHNIYNQLNISFQEMIDIQNNNSSANYHLIVMEGLRKFMNRTYNLELKEFDFYSIIQHYTNSYYDQQSKSPDSVLTEITKNIFRQITFQKLVHLKQENGHSHSISDYINHIQEEIPYCNTSQVSVDLGLIDNCQMELEMKIMQLEKQEQESKIDNKATISILSDISFNLSKQKIQMKQSLYNSQSEQKIQKDKQSEMIEIVIMQLFEAIQGVKFQIKKKAISLPLKIIIERLKYFYKIFMEVDSLISN